MKRKLWILISFFALVSSSFLAIEAKKRKKKKGEQAPAGTPKTYDLSDANMFLDLVNEDTYEVSFTGLPKGTKKTTLSLPIDPVFNTLEILTTKAKARKGTSKHLVRIGALENAFDEDVLTLNLKGKKINEDREIRVHAEIIRSCGFTVDFVCGEISFPNGTSVQKTFQNMCKLEDAAGAAFLFDGECPLDSDPSN